MNYRHGDLLIRPVEMSVDQDGRYEKKLDHLVLAFGEATGHKHEVVEGDVELFEEYGTLYLRVKSEEAKIAHPEHKPITLPKGTFRIDHQREHVPGENVERERRVLD